MCLLFLVVSPFYLVSVYNVFCIVIYCYEFLATVVLLQVLFLDRVCPERWSQICCLTMAKLTGSCWTITATSLLMIMMGMVMGGRMWLTLGLTGCIGVSSTVGSAERLLMMVLLLLLDFIRMEWDGHARVERPTATSPNWFTYKNKMRIEMNLREYNWILE